MVSPGRCSTTAAPADAVSAQPGEMTWDETMAKLEELERLEEQEGAPTPEPEKHAKMEQHGKPAPVPVQSLVERDSEGVGSTPAFSSQVVERRARTPSSAPVRVTAATQRTAAAAGPAPKMSRFKAARLAREQQEQR